LFAGGHGTVDVTIPFSNLPVSRPDTSMSALFGTRAHTGRVEDAANDDKHLQDICPELGRKQVEVWTSTTTGSTAGSSRHEQDDAHDVDDLGNE
jgi:hypothetical protein